ISIAQIARSVALIGIVLMLIVVLIGEFLMPEAERQAHEIRTAALSDKLSLSSRTGFWAKSGPLFVNIKSVLPDTTLVDVSVYDFNKGVLKSVVRAEQARQQSDGRWSLESVRRTRFAESSLQTETTDVELWPNLVNAELLKGLSVPAESMSVTNLFNQIRYLKRNQLDSRFTELALWTKITNPLSTLIMLMLSLPFVFASQRAGGVGQKMFIGILLGIGYFLLNRLVTHLGLANGLSPGISTMIPLLLFSAIAFVGLRRVT
ncbi:MAG: LPS export ABC transporter permease LptG, partial [Pseudomonadota bacterium]